MADDKRDFSWCLRETPPTRHAAYGPWQISLYLSQQGLDSMDSRRLSALRAALESLRGLLQPDWEQTLPEPADAADLEWGADPAPSPPPTYPEYPRRRLEDLERKLAEMEKWAKGIDEWMTSQSVTRGELEKTTAKLTEWAEGIDEAMTSIRGELGETMSALSELEERVRVWAPLEVWVSHLREIQKKLEGEAISVNDLKTAVAKHKARTLAGRIHSASGADRDLWKAAGVDD